MVVMVVMVMVMWDKFGYVFVFSVACCDETDTRTLLHKINVNQGPAENDKSHVRS